MQSHNVSAVHKLNAKNTPVFTPERCAISFVCLFGSIANVRSVYLQERYGQFSLLHVKVRKTLMNVCSKPLIQKIQHIVGC